MIVLFLLANKKMNRCILNIPFFQKKKEMTKPGIIRYPDDSGEYEPFDKWLIFGTIAYPRVKDAHAKFSAELAKHPENAAMYNSTPTKEEMDRMNLVGTAIIYNHGYRLGEEEPHFRLGSVIASATGKDGHHYTLNAINRDNSKIGRKSEVELVKDMLARGVINSVSLRIDAQKKEGKIIRKVYPELSVVPPDSEPVHKQCVVMSWDQFPEEVRDKMHGQLTSTFDKSVLRSWEIPVDESAADEDISMTCSHRPCATLDDFKQYDGASVLMCADLPDIECTGMEVDAENSVEDTIRALQEELKASNEERASLKDKVQQNKETFAKAFNTILVLKQQNEILTENDEKKSEESLFLSKKMSSQLANAVSNAAKSGSEKVQELLLETSLFSKAPASSSSSSSSQNFSKQTAEDQVRMEVDNAANPEVVQAQSDANMAENDAAVDPVEAQDEQQQQQQNDIAAENVQQEQTDVSSTPAQPDSTVLMTNMFEMMSRQTAMMERMQANYDSQIKSLEAKVSQIQRPASASAAAPARQTGTAAPSRPAVQAPAAQSQIKRPAPTFSAAAAPAKQAPVSSAIPMRTGGTFQPAAKTPSAQTTTLACSEDNAVRKKKSEPLWKRQLDSGEYLKDAGYGRAIDHHNVTQSLFNSERDSSESDIIPDEVLAQFFSTDALKLAAACLPRQQKHETAAAYLNQVAALAALTARPDPSSDVMFRGGENLRGKMGLNSDEHHIMLNCSTMTPHRIPGYSQTKTLEDVYAASRKAGLIN